MKHALAFTFALTALSAGSAFALPKASSLPTVIHKAEALTATTRAVKANTSNAVLVADNRKEFGSQYQRY